MASISNNPIYDALPISNDALDKGGVELLRAAVVDEELFIMARVAAFPGPGPWGWVLADVARRLASLHAAEGKFTEAKATDAIVDSFMHSFPGLGASAARHTRKGSKSARPAKSALSRSKRQVQSQSKSKPSARNAARRRGARAKPQKADRCRSTF
ncbi:MAG TPA: DUF5076 domain-containing protein [Xanthobacteraceae bacterium]|jgi:hypothetical protein|nr:DUF5076 domain-containing protein [Xanthobacteraceae bacterium]